jgi:CysZ protein
MYPFVKTVETFKKAGLIKIIIICAVLTLLMVSAAIGLITWLTSSLITFETGWLATLTTSLVGIVSGIGGWFMMPVIMIFIAGLFQEKVIYLTERAYYSDSCTEASQFWPNLVHDIKFTLWALLLNIIVLPFYLFGIGLIISIVLNSYLLGREFFESAAGYYIGKPAAKHLEQNNKKIIYTGGLVFTLLSLIPVINLTTPVFATVWMVHVYHKIAN